MTDLEKRRKAKEFVNYWNNHSKKEKQDDQTFWNMFLRDILEIEKPEKIIEYQKETDSNKTQWIDAYIKGTNIIIEQKSSGVDLLKKGNEMRTPYEQAKCYDDNMNKSKKANWIITCNFDTFHIYDMDNIKKSYVEIKLEELPTCYDNFNFLIDKSAKVNDKETAISKEAGKIIGNIYDEIEKILIDQELLNEQTKKDLNMFCVRLVFCCFAEDSGLFAKKQFRNFIDKADINHLQGDLLELFEVLNTNERKAFLREDLNAFPYVNGELFLDKIDIPPLNDYIKKLILEDACDGFDWSKINPTIFGAIFESTLNPETRRNGGMHYTSIENIHKVIDPLFLTELKREFSNIRKGSQNNVKINKLNALQDRLSNLIFLDPACGSGNFLTETYLELRRLENNILREIINLNKGQRALFSSDLKDLIKVRIQQFYGIEINDFAVAVSKTALWIAEYQMYLETLDLYSEQKDDFLPLDSYENIIEANALRIDWNEVVPINECNYIMGNPPFVGSKYSSETQKSDMDYVFNKNKSINYRTLDYVTCWFYIASKYIKNTSVKCALVSTNSITQGEQVGIIWKQMYENGMKIDFAHRTFRWDSEASIKAKVNCVIIGFSDKSNTTEKYIFENDKLHKVENINPYLIPASDIFVESRNKPYDDRKKMVAPNKPCDYNKLKIESNEYEYFIKKCPKSKKWIKRMVGAEEFINNKKRYCLWLVGCEPSELKSMPIVMERVNKCREARIKANTKESLRLSKTPSLFREQINPDNYLLIPCVSSEKRDYIPIGFLNKSVIPVMGTLIIIDADLFYFGLITSRVHMSWMRAVCGRLEMRYRYSKDIVYNNFPWPNPTDGQKKKIEKTAEKILKVRDKYSNSSLADLYNELTMPADLRKAHEENDKAVLKAYGFNNNMTEFEIVTELMKMYQDRIDN